MKTADRHLSEGDALALGKIQASHVESTRGGGLRFLAVHSGEETEYVVIRTLFEDGESIDVGEGDVLAVTTGTAMSAPTAWILVPTTEYGVGD